MDGKPSKPNTSRPEFYRNVDKVNEGAALYEGGQAKGVKIGYQKRGPVDGGEETDVRIADDYSKHLKSEWLKAKGY